MNNYERDYIKRISEHLKNAAEEAEGMLDSYKKDYYEFVMKLWAESLDHLAENGEDWQK